MNIWINEATLHSVNITLTDSDKTITKSFPMDEILDDEHPTTPEEAIRVQDLESYKPSLDPDTETLDFTDPENIKAHLDIPVVVTDDIEYREPSIEDITPTITEFEEGESAETIEVLEAQTPPIPEEAEVIEESQETPVVPDVTEPKTGSHVEDILENVKFKNPLTNMYITWDKSAEMVIMDRHREKDICQCWSLITVKDDAEPHIPKFRIKNSFTDEYLVFKDFEDIDNKERKTLKERDIITAPLGEGSEFLWLLVPIPPNTSTDNILIINSRSKLVCDIYMHAVVPGTKIIQYNFRGGNNQLFTLEKV